MSDKKKLCPYCGNPSDIDDEDNNEYYCDRCDHYFDGDDE